MADEIRLDGLSVTPEVLETIATIATREVEGVAAVPGSGIAGLVGGKRGVSVCAAEGSDGLLVELHLKVEYGAAPLRDVARSVQVSIADALTGMTGHEVAAVDVYVDGIVFPE
jgi:uncharacterized alkaline shock family protein YloU